MADFNESTLAAFPALFFVKVLVGVCGIATVMGNGLIASSGERSALVLRIAGLTLGALNVWLSMHTLSSDDAGLIAVGAGQLLIAGLNIITVVWSWSNSDYPAISVSPGVKRSPYLPRPDCTRF